MSSANHGRRATPAAQRHPVCQCGATGTYQEHLDLHVCPASGEPLEQPCNCPDTDCVYRERVALYLAQRQAVPEEA